MATRKIYLPKLKSVDKKYKRYHYRLKDPFSKRKLAIDAGVRAEQRKKNITLRKAALAKKGRFNILRIYRRYRDPAACRKITHDIKYMDKKYKLGTTRNICNKMR